VGIDPEAAALGVHEIVPPTATSRIRGSSATAPSYEPRRDNEAAAVGRPVPRGMAFS
jgi:hypothetical protein